MGEPRYDAIVVGAGVLGCSVAHRLGGRGTRVALIDRGFVGSGCSGHAGAIATPLAHGERLRTMSAVSRVWYAGYHATHPDAPLRYLPIVFLVGPETDQALRKRCLEPLTEPSPVTVPGWLTVDRGHRLLGGPLALHARVADLCRHLSRRQGVEVYECAPVLSLAGTDGDWRVRLSDGRHLCGRALVLATGSWNIPGPAEGRTSTRTSTRTKKIVSYTLDLPAGPHDPVIYLPDHDAFLLPRPELRQWWLSITSTEWGCVPDDGPAASPADLRIAHAVLDRFAPVARPALRGGSVHCDSYLDGTGPHASRSPGSPVVVTGGSGSGFRYAPAVAAQAADLLAEGDPRWRR